MKSMNRATRVPNRRPGPRNVNAARGEKPVKHVPEKKRPASKVVEAAKKAEETLDLLKEQEDIEQERVRNKTNNNVLSGELDWLQYLKPKDTRDISSCADLDAYNHGVYQHNNAMLPKVNELLVKLGLPKKTLDPPTKYVPNARAEYEKMLFDESFRVLAGVKYLAKRDIFPERDYKTEESYIMADNIAYEEEIKRKVEEATDEGIDISAAAGSGHKNNCTCENRWDGEDERCVGLGVRVRWKRLKDHHFLRPRVIPEVY